MFPGRLYTSSRSSHKLPGRGRSALDWKLADAKNRLRELVVLVLTEGPQRIRLRGDAVVVLSEARYRALTGERPTLRDMLLHGPSLEGVELERDRSLPRDIEL